MLNLSRDLGIHLVGCTFHVGSRCYDPQIFAESIKMARRVFDMAQSEKFGFKFYMLDIGGGFVGHHLEEPSLPKVASVINSMLDTLFPDEEGKEKKYAPFYGLFSIFFVFFKEFSLCRNRDDTFLPME